MSDLPIGQQILLSLLQAGVRVHSNGDAPATLTFFPNTATSSVRVLAADIDGLVKNGLAEVCCNGVVKLLP
jgi:hypothetical protein